ncbi:MAG: DUF5317 domain-containing protein [Chloroflexota bacterium]
MILLIGLLAGLLVGLVLGYWRKQTWKVPSLRHTWLAIVAFVPQLFAIYIPGIRTRIPSEWASVSLIISLGLLLVFCWLNRKNWGMMVLAAGLVLNLSVILLNGGFMPISPETASRLVPEEVISTLESGSRFGWKDILLLPEETRLAFLADHYLPPAGFPYQVAFSLGDIFIATGAFVMMALGSRHSPVPSNLLPEETLC